MTPSRWPLLLLIPAAFIAGIIFDDRERNDVETEAESVDGARIETPVVQPPGAGTQVWYCSGMTTGPEATNQGAIILSNVADGDRTAIITAYASTDTIADAPVVNQIDLPVGSRVDFTMDQLIDRPGFAAATIEIDDAGVLVERSMVGLGLDRQPCSTSTSTTWVDPAGSTLSPDGREVLVLFNPFAADAVVDLKFATEFGERITTEGEGLVVRGGSVTQFELTERITEAEIVSTSLVVRSGQVVLDRLQTFDGSGDLGREGLSSATAAAQASDIWYFPHFRLDEGRQELLVIYNPSAERAEIDIEIYPQADAGVVIPFERSILGGQREVIDLSDAARLQEAGVTDFSAIVVAANGIEVVPSRFLSMLPALVDATELESGDIVEPSIGLGSHLGSTNPAARHLVDINKPTGADGSQLFVFNPSVDSIVTAELVLPASDAPIASLEVPPRSFEILLLDDLEEASTIEVQASGEVVVGRELAGLTSRSVALGVPLADG